MGNITYNGQVVDENGDGIPYAHIETELDEILDAILMGFLN